MNPYGSEPPRPPHGPHHPLFNRNLAGSLGGALGGSALGGTAFGQFGMVPGLVGSLGTSLLGSAVGGHLANKTYGHHHSQGYAPPPQSPSMPQSSVRQPAHTVPGAHHPTYSQGWTPATYYQPVYRAY
eukprot:EG_transcript_28086